MASPGWVSPGCQETWDLQLWLEAGRALGRCCLGWPRVAAPVVDSVLFFTALGPDRDTTRTWCTPTFSFLSDSARDFCSFLQCHWLKDNYTQPQTALHHGLTGSWKLPIAVDKVRSLTLAFPFWNLPLNKVSDLWTHWLVLLVCVGIWGKLLCLSLCNKNQHLLKLAACIYHW